MAQSPDRACPINPRIAHILCPGLSGAVLLIVALALAVACSSPTPTPVPVAEEGDRVLLHYHGTLDDGTVFDSSRDRLPFELVVGSGQVIEGFDNAVRGLAVGETVTVRIEPAEAYGERIPELILEVPLDQVSAEEVSQIAVGMVLVLPNGAQAVVTSITDTTLTLDANPRLAGEALTFEIELVEIFKPTSAPEPAPVG